MLPTSGGVWEDIYNIEVAGFGNSQWLHLSAQRLVQYNLPAFSQSYVNVQLKQKGRMMYNNVLL